jgi:hypothetical protein
MRSCSACVSGVCFQRSQKLVRSLRSDVPDIEANAPMAQSNWIVVPQAQTGIVIDWNGCLKPKTAKNSRSAARLGALGRLGRCGRPVLPPLIIENSAASLSEHRLHPGGIQHRGIVPACRSISIWGEYPIAPASTF